MDERGMGRIGNLGVTARDGTTGTERTGFSLPEALTTLLLLTLVLPGAWAVFVQHRNAAMNTAHQVEAMASVRTVSWVLSRELSGSRPGLDSGPPGTDSLPLRVFRGLGAVVPGSVETDRVRVCFRGIRSPNPEKDSVLFLGADGTWRSFGLAARVALGVPCSFVPGGWEEEWTLAGPAIANRYPVAGRVFESGSYHFNDGAFRYRRGAGGRQPLTPERIREGAFAPEDAGKIRWEVVVSRRAESGDTMPWRGVCR